MLFKTMIMFLFFKWSISSYLLSYSITDLLGLIGLTLTFISEILGIKAYSIEIMKQLKQVSPNYKSPTSSVSAIAAIYPFYFHLNIQLHILNTISWFITKVKQSFHSCINDFIYYLIGNR